MNERGRFRLRPRTLRGRLAAVFGLGTVAISLLVGGFVLFRYHDDLSRQTDENLQTRFADVRAELSHTQKPVTGRDLPIIPRAEVFAQVLDTRGHVLAASPKALLDRPLLDRAQLRSLDSGRRTINRSVPPRADDARLLAGIATVGEQRLAIVVGTSLVQLQAAEDQLVLALAIGLPVLAALVIAGGWLIAGAALRPVRSMVEEADAYSTQRRGQRLTVADTGELAELARRLNAMLARIEDAIDHERAFLDDASHELRTPIAIARAELELAAMQAGTDDEATEALRSALEEIERLDHLAVNLLVLARMRAAGPPSGEPVDLGALAERAVAGVTRARGATDVALHVSGHATAPGDEVALERAVTNLVDNAARHARARVEVSVAQSRGTSTIEVHDDGPGFSGELLDRALDRFVRGDSGGSAGLGLAIVDAIAGAHGGRVEIANDPEGGACVRMRLPSDAADVRAAPARA